MHVHNKAHILIITFYSTRFGAYCAIFGENFLVRSNLLLHFVLMKGYVFNCNWLDTRWQQCSTHLVDTR
jgi:hypothetical protein